MAWSQLTSIKGPQGDQGPTGAGGPQGVQGDPGVDGAGIAIAGSVATYDDLPSGLGPSDAGDGYLVEDDGLLYVWSGTDFPGETSGVAFRGPVGATGSQGVAGSTGAQGIQGVAGDAGGVGATGPRGSTWYTGTGAPGTISGAVAGDLYLDSADGTVYRLA